MRGESEEERALSACANVVTGCYDHNIRLWDVGSDEVLREGSAIILKVVQGHKSHINSIVIDAARTKVYSADGVGQVRVWKLERHAFDCLREVNDAEVKGDAINCLRIDRSGRQLVMLARDNCIRCFDTERWTITQVTLPLPLPLPFPQTRPAQGLISLPSASS